LPIGQFITHLACLLLMPPLLQGIIIKVKAAFAGRVGAPLLQPYFDIIKLMRKSVVVSRTTTWLFRAGPVVGLVTSIAAGLIVPLGFPGAPLAFVGDLVFFAYLFGLGRFFTVLAALDTGSAFEGMGATREVTFACLAEPALFLGLLVLAKRSASLSLSTMLDGAIPEAWSHATAPVLLVIVSLFIVVLAENSRIPVDDPNTHLELTMIHEVMVLDHSGPPFGMILYGASIKLFVLGTVVVRAALPFDFASTAGNWAAYLMAMVGFAATIGVVESTMARLRLHRVTNLLIAACLLSAFGIILLAR
jgi:formate hydrogenlyase subunit 4